jgi:hypothetical protein
MSGKLGILIESKSVVSDGVKALEMNWYRSSSGRRISPDRNTSSVGGSGGVLR